MFLARRDNRATTATPLSQANGDFQSVTVTINGAFVQPYLINDNGVPAVYIDGGRFITNSGFAANEAIWTTSDWTLEAWYKMDSREVGGELPIFQWGQRTGPSGGCRGAYLSGGVSGCTRGCAAGGAAAGVLRAPHHHHPPRAGPLTTMPACLLACMPAALLPPLQSQPSWGAGGFFGSAECD